MLETLLDALPRAQEHRLAGRAHGGLLLRVGLEIVAIGLGGKPGADPAMARHVRSQRSLGSHDRRLVTDLAYGVVRDRRLLERLLALAGTEKPTQEDLWRANLALCHGSFPEGQSPSECLRNPRKALKTWAAQESPGQEQLLAELGSKLKLGFDEKTILHSTVYEDNNGALSLAQSPRMTPRTKYIAVEYHWFRDHVGEDKGIVLKKVDSEFQKSDIFTKGLVQDIFERIRKLLLGW